MKNLGKTEEQFIYLLGCAVNSIPIKKERIGAVDSEALLRLSSFHSTSALAASALAPLLSDRELFSAEQAKKWNNARGEALRKAVLRNSETDSLRAYFEKSGVRYMLLKGSVIQDFYPVFGVREMTDVDILFDRDRAAEVRDHMKSAGFSVKYYNKTHHDVYEKPPIFSFELHRTLCSPLHKELYAYYENVWDRLIRVTPHGMEYRFTDDDFYIFDATHACRQFARGGTGLRALLDLYLCEQKLKLDRAYIERELDRLGYLDTERRLREMGAALFSRQAVENGAEEADSALLEYLISSGSIGTQAHIIANELEKYSGNGKSKRRGYIRGRVFISEAEMKNLYPFFYRHKAARPLLLVHRGFKGLTFNRKKLKTELKLLKEAENSQKR